MSLFQFPLGFVYTNLTAYFKIKEVNIRFHPTLIVQHYRQVDTK